MLLTVLCVSTSLLMAWESKIVHYDDNNRLIYSVDDEGNRIPDFSHAGYAAGGVPIPDVPVVKTISPIEGDNTQHIQNAFFELSFYPKDAHGFRGALLLAPGIYEIKGTVRLQGTGVVLRGSGNGADPSENTILWATGNTPSKRAVVIAGGGSSSKWREEVSGTRVDIVSDSVMLGDTAIEVSDASLYSVGDNIIIYHPCTEEWLEAIDYGGTFSTLPAAEPGVDVPWAVGSQPIVFNRNITSIEGNVITIDVPVFNHLIRSLSQSYIYKYARTGLQTKIGIEELRIDIETEGGADEAHAWNAIEMYLIEDAWVRNCTMLHFGLSGIETNTATRVTIENCEALDPVSVIEGGKRYNFCVYTASQQILFKECRASNGRHHYISNGMTWTSGCVFLDCTSEGAYTSSEGHRRWSMGLLYDNLIELDGPRPGFNPRLLGLYNRGHYGTSHGWAAAHSVAWNCDVADGDLIVQKPPTAQNYAIGCSGKNITGVKPPSPFDVPEGYIEGSNEAGLFPRSLYEAQLQNRLSTGVDLRSIESDANIIAGDFTLHQNYPNPFNPETTISFRVFRKSDFLVSIYNVKGEQITMLLSETLGPGSYSTVWHAGQNPSGVYFVRMESDNFSETRRIVLIR